MAHGKKHRSGGRWHVDFSLALFNRSGKYQIGKEILEHHPQLIDSVWYWRWSAAQTPSGLMAKVLGKAEKIERDLRVAVGTARPPKLRASECWLHLDALTVCHRRVGPQDIVLCHDLGPLTHPELFPPGTGAAYDLAFRTVYESGAHVVAVSHDTLNRFSQLYGAPAKASVIYPPIASRLKGEQQTRPQGVGKRFLLTVGAMGDRKNQANSIRAFVASGLAGQGVEYVLCGSREPGYEAVVEAAAKAPGVKLLSFVKDEELRWLYANAAGFVLASRLEGFGMPVAEAMAFGLVPIISRDSVLEEVAGEAAIPVSPDDREEIADAMRNVLTLEENMLSARREAMQSRLQAFSSEAFNCAWSDLLSGIQT